MHPYPSNRVSTVSEFGNRNEPIGQLTGRPDSSVNWYLLKRSKLPQKRHEMQRRDHQKTYQLIVNMQIIGGHFSNHHWVASKLGKSPLIGTFLRSASCHYYLIARIRPGAPTEPPVHETYHLMSARFQIDYSPRTC